MVCFSVNVRRPWSWAFWRFVFVLALLSPADPAWALGYLRNQDLAQQLQSLAQAQPNLVRLTSIAQTLGRQEVWLVEAGSGTDSERNGRPAMLLVAGIEGNDLVGTASALAWIERLATDYQTNDSIRQLLDTSTLYLFPCMNPDAADHYFAHPRNETAVNPSPVDEDHDGLIDEDGPDDLNGDGLITGMRIQDAAGDYILDPADPRLLLKADRAKGEAGAWRFYTEGIDNDGDEAWNEDGLGGVNLNRNFPYNYSYFSSWAGRHQVSEVESRALADFVVAHPNISLIFTFGAADNLVQTPGAESRDRKPPAGIHPDDLPYYRELGKAWREGLGLKKELDGAAEPGTFSDWMYFHRGRLSLSARAWSPALQLQWAKNPIEEHKNDRGEPEAKSPPDQDKRNEQEREFLKWIDKNAPSSFIPWKPIEHPDFPGKRVEIGGFTPFAKTHPPENLLPGWVENQGKFLTRLLGMLPRISIRKIQVKSLGASVFEVTVQVENTGFLPTALAQGEVTGEVYPTRVVLDLDERQILSGTRITRLGPIEGKGGMKEVRYILQAKGPAKIEVNVISMLGGSARTTFELKENN